MGANQEQPKVDFGYDLALVGLGYVGLPLATVAANAGLTVLGYDIDLEKVANVAEGLSHVGDVPNESLRQVLEMGLTVTTDPEGLRSAEAIVLAVPTPLVAGQPDLSSVVRAAETVAGHLGKGQMVVLESTTYPGTTEEVLLPILERGSGLVAGRDFALAYSPERVDPANPTWTIENIPKLVAGLDANSTLRARSLYSRFCRDIVTVSGLREAEMAKLLENTYRHVNIALMNEMSVFCDEMEIDLWEVIRAASTKPFGYQPFYPGPGVGGHCIPIDPNYLSYRVKQLGYPFRFVELASEINDRMPNYVAQRLGRALNSVSLPIRGSNVLLVGVAYKANVSDERESPAIPVAAKLRELGAEVAFIDPLVDTFTVDGVSARRFIDPVAAGEWCDIAAILTPHEAIDLGLLTSAAPLVFDTRGVIKGDSVERL